MPPRAKWKPNCEAENLTFHSASFGLLPLILRNPMSHNAALFGVDLSVPCTVPFDPGYDACTVSSHLEQSYHLMHFLKLSMATWVIANGTATHQKIEQAQRYGVKVVAGGGPFEIAYAKGRLPQYIELCASVGFNRIEVAEGFAADNLNVVEIVDLVSSVGLSIQYEVGRKFSGCLDDRSATKAIDRAVQWLDAGAEEVVIEGREDATNVGLFDSGSNIDFSLAERFVDAVRGDLRLIQFEAPTKTSQFAFLSHFGRGVQLSNVRLEELLRVECYRHHLHADSFIPSAIDGIE